jgi:hypothetical protein
MSHAIAEKAVASAGTAKMMGPMMGKMDMGSMMDGGMGAMMKGGMGPMMKEGMGPMMSGMGPMMKSPGVATGVASGVVASAGSSTGKSVIKKIFTHPLVLFGLGAIAGCYLYKYRKSIISTSKETQPEE